jgi:hypothetical protein
MRDFARVYAGFRSCTLFPFSKQINEINETGEIRVINHVNARFLPACSNIAPENAPGCENAAYVRCRSRRPWSQFNDSRLGGVAL